MDAQQFAYWLQGFAELSGDAPPTKAQWKSIREHLGLVFEKVTPAVGAPNWDDQPAMRKLIPNINEMLRWPPQTSDDSARWPRGLPVVRCSSSQVVAVGSDGTTRTYC